MLRRVHFPEFFITLIQNCIATTQIAIRFNQHQTPYFKPSRSLRQWDPVSPLLFIKCMQAFTSLIELGIEEGWWKQIYVWNNRLNISHLIFLEDITLFSKRTTTGLHDIQDLLSMFNQATRQMVNLHKSQVLFSNKAQQFFKDFVRNLLGMQQIDKQSLY